MNDLQSCADIFKGMKPWSGVAPAGYMVDFLGTLTDARFRMPFGIDPATVGGVPVATRLPVIEDGEGWFEAVNWVEAAREARGRYVMITLGACYAAKTQADLAPLLRAAGLVERANQKLAKLNGQGDEAVSSLRPAEFSLGWFAYSVACSFTNGRPWSAAQAAAFAALLE